MTPSPASLARPPKTAVPPPIFLAFGGLAAITLLIVGAAVVRTPPADEYDDDETAAVADASASARAPIAAKPIKGKPIKAEPKEPAKTEPERPAGLATATAPPAGAQELRAKFRDDVDKRRFKSAVASLGQLLEVDPDAPRSGEVRGDIVELSMRVMLVEGPEPDQVFDLIVHHMGTTGPDILYELLTTRGGSRAAARAEELLKDASVRAIGTPAMRIAYDLRTAHSCEDKSALFERAKTDGDGRTLGQLQLLSSGRRCGRRGGSECCFQNDPALKAATDAIKQR